MNFDKLVPFAKTEMQKMTDEDFLKAAEVFAKEILAEYKRRGIAYDGDLDL